MAILQNFYFFKFFGNIFKYIGNSIVFLKKKRSQNKSK